MRIVVFFTLWCEYKMLEDSSILAKPITSSFCETKSVSALMKRACFGIEEYKETSPKKCFLFSKIRR